MCEFVYHTRDKDGNEIRKTVALKKYPVETVDFSCGICKKEYAEGITIKKIVSENFTDWQYVSPYICCECSKFFSLFPFSYILNGNQIRLFNIREMAEEIQKEQEPPFKIVVTASQKKHLFYKAATNSNSKSFIANLEEEQIYCDIRQLREQFAFIGNMQALGESKKRLAAGEIRHDILLKVGYKALKYLNSNLKTRQIQIPLHLSQKPEIKEEDALCKLNLILNQ